MSDLADVAFIGLGALGLPMAANLLAAGHRLHIHNRNRQRLQPLLEGGALAAASPAAAARAAAIVCLCLSDDAAVHSVLLDQQEAAIEGLAPGSLVIDFSTIAPASSEALAARLAQAGVGYLDAPVTGGTEGARNGSLSILVGGDAADLERARPLLTVLGNRITHLGPVGAGQRAKAVNQVLVAGSYAAVAEALALGQRLDLPMPQLCEALQEGAAGSWALRHRSANMLQGTFPLGFRLALHHKDLSIALAAAAAAGLELPISGRVAAMEAELMAAGHGDDDVSALARWFGPPPAAISAEAAAWDQRYHDGRDGWELGQAAPPLAAFLQNDPLAPQPPGRVLVPGCGRGHEAALLARLGFTVIGLDISAAGLAEARRLQGADRPELRWLQADLFDAAALDAAGLTEGSLQGVVEHTCFCAIPPQRRADYLRTVTRLLAPGGWLLGLFWCHSRPDGPPYGSDPRQLAGQLADSGLEKRLWQPAQGSVPQRPEEWLGLWQRPAS